MSTRAFITGVSGTGQTAAERAVVRAGGPWDFIPFIRGIQNSIQIAVSVTELAEPRPLATNRAGVSIPVDGAAEPAHPVTTSATMIAQVIRSAVGFQALLMSDDVSKMNALAGATRRFTATTIRHGARRSHG